MTTGNTLKIVGLLATLTALFVLIGGYVGGQAARRSSSSFSRWS